MLIWQLVKTLWTIQKQGKFLLLPAAETLRCTVLLAAVMTKSLVDRAFVAALVEMNLAARSVTGCLLSSPPSWGASRPVQCQPSHSHPLVIAVLLQPLTTETSSCHLQWSEINTTGLTIYFKLKFLCFLACFLAMHAVLPGCKVQLWTVCYWTQVLSAQDCIAEPPGNCFQCQVFDSSQIWCSDIILSLCFSKGTKVSTYGIDRDDLSINVFCSHTEGQRWQLSSYGYFCWRKPPSFQRCCRHFQAWYLLLSSVSIHHLPRYLKGACSHCCRSCAYLSVVLLRYAERSTYFPLWWQWNRSCSLCSEHNQNS